MGLIFAFAVPYAAVTSFLERATVIEEFDGGVAEADAELWVMLVGTTAGTAGVLSVLSVSWLWGMRKVPEGEPPSEPQQAEVPEPEPPREPQQPEVTAQDMRRSAAMVSLVVAGILFALWVGHLLGPADAQEVGTRLDNRTRWVTSAIVVAVAPALMVFSAIQSAATGGARPPDSSSVRRLRKGRYRLQRQLTGFGVLLTLAVVATGKRRDMLIARTTAEGAVEDVPIESVLLYGLAFAAVLAVIYSASASALKAEAEKLVEAYAPTPEPKADVEAWSKQHSGAIALIDGGGGLTEQRRTFEAAVVVAAPLVTGLLNASLA